MPQNKDSVLLVDDDSDALLSLSRTIKTYLPNVEILGAGNADKALLLQKEFKPQVAVVDLELNQKEGVQSGLKLMTLLQKNDPDIRVVVLTGHSSLEHGMESVKKGASSFLEKPANIESLSFIVQDALNSYHLRSNLRQKSQDTENVILSRLVGKSEKIQKLRQDLLFASSTNQSVFLSGESGVGKGLCASLIHTLSKRADRKFIRYQPVFVSGDLVNSDLFGHQKGSFTGADKDRDGLLKEVSEGTLFLDEIDALPIETQVMLLGVLQDKIFRPVGSNQEVGSDFRLVSASNAAMQTAISAEKIRKDFYFRIAHQTIFIPSLRERISDIPDLVESILLCGRERKDYSVYGFTTQAELKLKNHFWPGNIRELQSVVDCAAFRAQYNSRFEIEEEDITFSADKEKTDEHLQDTEEAGFHAKVLSFKKNLIREALARNGGNQVQAARELGLDRSSMRRIIADEL